MAIVLLNIVVITIIIGIAIGLTLIAIGLIIGSLVRASLEKKKGKKTHKVGMWIGLVMLILPWIFVAFTVISFKVYEQENHVWDGSKLQEEIVTAVTEGDQDALNDMMAEDMKISPEEVGAFLATADIVNDGPDDIKRYTSNFGEYRNDYRSYDELITFGSYRPESETQSFFSFYMYDINDNGDDIYIAGVNADKDSEDGVGICYMVLASSSGDILASVGEPQTWTTFRTPEVDQVIYDMTVDAGYEPSFTIPDQSSFFAEQGLSISPQGDFAFMSGQHDGENDLGEFELTGNVMIYETTCPEREGYKIVTAIFECDMSGVDEGLSPACWMSAFDRYTGTSFEFDSTQIQEGESMLGGVQFDYEGKTYDVSMEYGFEWNEEEQTRLVVIDVTCPADYDGTVFQIGYSDLAINEANYAIDYSARLYTVDELPGYGSNGHTYLYYSASDS